jgi:aspartate aminotransferase
MLSSRLNSVKPSPTLALSAQAKALRLSGKNIIDLCVGEPDFPTPQSAQDAAIDAIHQGFTKYTPVDGIPDLKKAIQNKFNNDQGISYELNQITIGNGAKQVLFNALMATIEPNDEVIIPAPYWVSYPDMVSLLGGKPVIVDCPHTFKITELDFESYITPKTKWIILNSPSNPTGAIYNESELRTIAEVLKRHPHVWILSDDIYESLVYDGKFYNILKIDPSLKERTVVVNGVSKAYSMTGWRIGYAAGPTNIIQAMTLLQSQTSSNPCSISQYAALGGMTGDQSFLNEWKAVFIRRRNAAMAIVHNTSGLSCESPAGAFYLFINCEQLMGKKTPEGKLLMNDTEVCQFLLNEGGVATVPGSAFGLNNHFRVSYAIDDSILNDAMTRIQRAVISLN